MRKILFMLAFVGSLAGCQSVLNYDSVPKVYEQKNFSLKTFLKFDPQKRQATLQMDFKNKSSNEILFQYPGAELRTTDSLSTLPYNGSKIPMEVQPGRSASVTLSFYPVNSRFYYQRIGFRGDLRKEYVLPLNFIQTKTNTPLDTNVIHLSCSDQQYKSYLSRYGKEKSIHIYSFAQTNEMIKAFRAYYASNGMNVLFEHHHHNEKEANNHEEAKENHADHPVSFFLSGDELILGKFSFKILAFTYNNKLRLYFKVINRVPNLLYFDVDKLKVKVGKKAYAPLKTYQAALTEFKKNMNQKNADLKANEVYIGQNDRLEFFVEYKLAEFPDRFVLDASSLETENRSHVLGVPLVFAKEK